MFLKEMLKNRVLLCQLRRRLVAVQIVRLRRRLLVFSHYIDFQHFLKKLFIIVSIITFFIASFARAQVFQVEPLALEKSKGRNIATCTAGLTQFLSAGLGYESFSDYWRDFFLWPLHYADVSRIQNQVNKSRYAVVSAFLRCDLNRLKAVTNAYYKLEAELHFVRHFVDTSGGFLHILTEDPGERETFANDMVNKLLLKKISSDEEKDRALFSAYFDEFEAKYKEQAKTYKSFGDDPVYKELIKKFDQLIETFKSFGKGTARLGSGGEEKAQSGKQVTSSGDAKTTSAPKRSIKEKAISFLSKFIDACVETSGLSRFDITKSGVSSPESRHCFLDRKSSDPFPQPIAKRSSDKKTFEEVIIAVTKREILKTQDLDKAELLTRYEVLYGEVNGGGIRELMEKMNKLNAILGNGVDGTPALGSSEPLNKLNQCAAEVLKRQCS